MTGPEQTHPDMHSLTGAYAMDALDDDERRAFEAHLVDCDTCRDEVEGFHATTAALGGATAEPPPSHLRDAVLAEVSRTSQEAPPAQPAPQRPVTSLGEARSQRRGFMDRILLPAAAVLALVVAGLSVVVTDLNQRIDELSVAGDVADVVAASDLQTWEAEMPDGGTARVMWSSSRGEGWFIADEMAPAEEGKAYELWVIDDEGPSPAGLFDAHDGRALHAFSGDMDAATAIGVTVEPESGSPAPTTDPLVVVEL